jgi:hypothetical protein
VKELGKSSWRKRNEADPVIPNNVYGLLFADPHQQLLIFISLMIAILAKRRWNLSVV